MERLAKHIDDRWDNDEDITFYTLERDVFGGYKHDRMGLYHTLRYFRLHGMFDDQVFKRINENFPSEAHGLMDAFDLEEIYL